LRLLTRNPVEIEQLAGRLASVLQDCCKKFEVVVSRTHSQVGSGALPIDRLQSAALKITRPDLRRPGAALNRLAKTFRELPVPVIGRISNDALWFDLRCLEDEEGVRRKPTRSEDVMIIATAGHVDHGKTELVKALTGIDTDRLPEERARGLSVDLGFAYHTLPDNTILGFVDVPGHEKFIRNMLAGVAGIDLGLLVVAADDGGNAANTRASCHIEPHGYSPVYRRLDQD